MHSMGACMGIVSLWTSNITPPPIKGSIFSVQVEIILKLIMELSICLSRIATSEIDENQGKPSVGFFTSNTLIPANLIKIQIQKRISYISKRNLS